MSEEEIKPFIKIPALHAQVVRHIDSQVNTDKDPCSTSRLGSLLYYESSAFSGYLAVLCRLSDSVYTSVM